MSARSDRLFLRHSGLGWAVDCTTMGLSIPALDALPWRRAFDEMAALEGGAIANADEERQVGHYWLRAPEVAPTIGQARAIGEAANGVRELARQVRLGEKVAPDGLPYQAVLHVGIGGSALGPQLLVDALAERGGGLELHFLDNTDPDGIERVIRALGDRLRHTLCVVVSKSGSTPETRNGMLLVEEAFRRRGHEVAPRMIAITGDGSELHQRARREGWMATFPLWDWVGGRTSITSAVGLLPAELAGVDTQALLEGARVVDDWSRADRWDENPAALLAASWYGVGGGRGDRAMVVLPYSDRLLTLSRYLQQLVMESLGKRLDRRGNEVDQGLVVYGNKGSTDQHAFVQQLRDGRDDFFALLVQVLEDGVGSASEVAPGANAGDFLQGFLLGTRRALRERGRPVSVLTVPRVDATTLGGIVALFERAVGLYASLIDVNAYHQPGVEAGKAAARGILALAARLKEELGAEPRAVDALAAALHADPLEVLYLAERLVLTGRARRGPDDTYLAVTG